MSVKLLITYFVFLIPLNGMCDGRNITNEAIEYWQDRYQREFAGYDSAFDILTYLVIPTVAAVGVCGNVVALVVWSAETTFNPTTFLVKCLTVTDIITLLAVICNGASRSYPGIEQAIVRFALMVATFYCRMVSAHTTLGVVVTRWVAIHKPLRVHSLLTKLRVVVGYVLVLLWCLTPAIPLGLLFSGRIDSDNVVIIYNVCAAVYVALPSLLLVVLNVSLVCTLCSHRHSSVMGQQQQPRTARAARTSRLLGAVLCVSITTVLAYPVVVAYRVLKVGLGVEICERGCSNLLLILTFLLEAFNSSINVVYYLVFASRFRQLCRLRCGCCYGHCCCWQ